MSVLMLIFLGTSCWSHWRTHLQFLIPTSDLLTMARQVIYICVPSWHVDSAKSTQGVTERCSGPVCSDSTSLITWLWGKVMQANTWMALSDNELKLRFQSSDSKKAVSLVARDSSNVKPTIFQARQYLGTYHRTGNLIILLMILISGCAADRHIPVWKPWSNCIYCPAAIVKAIESRIWIHTPTILWHQDISRGSSVAGRDNLQVCKESIPNSTPKPNLITVSDYCLWLVQTTWQSCLFCVDRYIFQLGKSNVALAVGGLKGKVYFWGVSADAKDVDVQSSETLSIWRSFRLLREVVV